MINSWNNGTTVSEERAVDEEAVGEECVQHGPLLTNARMMKTVRKYSQKFYAWRGAEANDDGDAQFLEEVLQQQAPHVMKNKNNNLNLLTTN